MEETTMADATDIVRQMISAWNAHDPDGVARHVSNDFVSESDTLPSPLRGPEAVKQSVRMYVGAFSDLHFEIEQIMAAGDFVTMRWVATGTHDGELMGIPPTRKRAVTHGCTVEEFRNGKAVREWVYWDTGNLVRQIGVLPGAPGAASR
jgi:steroid delta-isomerase-like uncharacterized protein